MAIKTNIKFFLVTLKTDCIIRLKRALWLQEVEATRICIQSAHEVDKFVNPTHRLPLPRNIDPYYYFFLEADPIPVHNVTGRNV
jgi:hypothetical protein